MAQTLIARALPSQLGATPDRYINDVLSEGVWEADHFKVVEQAAPGMSVRCGSGTPGDMAVVEGAAAMQHRYIIENQDAYVGSGDAELSIGNGDPSDPRIDLVVLRVYDDEKDSSGQTKAQVEVVPGTPESPVPATPATPAGAYALASIFVGPGESTSIEAGDITDLRGTTKVRGQYAATVRGTSSGTFSKGDYPWARAVRVRLWGGGSGGLGDGGTDNEGGPGGGGAGYCEKWYTIDELDASEPYTIGNGGNGSQVGPTAGGDTTFKGMTARGGQPPADHARGGTGGTASGGDVNLTGGNAESRAAKATYPNTTSPATNGGDAAGPEGGKGGVGAAARAANVHGGNGNIPGGGGGGGFRRTAGTLGGNGARGEAVFELFA